MRIQKIIVTNCHAVTLSHQPYLAGDGHSSMLLLWGYRRTSDNAQLSFRQKIFFGRGKFSNDLSLAKRPLAPFSILSPCCLFLATFSIHSPLLPLPCSIQHPLILLPLPCSVHAIYTHPVAPHNNNLRFLRLYSVLPPSLTLPPPPAP